MATADIRAVLAAAHPKPPQVGPTLWHAVGPFLHELGGFLAHDWWLVVLLGAGLAGRGGLWLVRERRLARSGISEIDQMDGLTFERRLVHLFASRGYRVEQTSARGDYGADLIIEKGGKRTVVQAKRWTKNVGVKAIQEAVAAKPMYQCDHAMVVTNRDYTDQAKRLARANGVQLWNRDDLIRALLTDGDPALAPAAPIVDL